MYITFCIVTFFVLLVSAQTPRELTNSQRVYLDPSGSGAIAAAGQVRACTSSLHVLTNNPTQCLTSANADGSAASSSGCPAPLVGSSALSCLDNLICFALNPVTNNIVGFNNVGTVLVTFGGASLTSPKAIAAYLRNSASIEVYVADHVSASTTSLWQFTLSAPFTSASANKIVDVTNSNVPVGIDIYGTNADSLWVSFQSATSINRYSLSGVSQGTFGTFGGITLSATDYYGQVYVYDTACSCIKILDATGVWTKMINTTSVPTFLSVSRNHIFVVDQDGVLRYSDDLVVDVAVSNITCAARGGSMTVDTMGGAYPFTYKLYPDQIQNTTNSDSVTFSNLMTVPTRYPWKVITDRLSFETTLASTAPTQLVTSSTFAPHSGSASFRVQFTPSGSFGFTCVSCIDTKIHDTLEFWLNVAGGGQLFALMLDSTLVRNFDASNFPSNNWTKVTVDLRDLPLTQYSSLSLTDTTGLSAANWLYIDDMTLLPYNFTQRAISVTDSCGASVTVPFAVVEQNVMSAVINTTSTSCNDGNYNPGNKSTDGAAIAVVSNGVAPFTYAWSFSSQNSWLIQNLPAMASNVTIYANSLNASFSDFSVADSKNMADTSAYRSAPSSFSMTANADSQAFAFVLNTTLDSNDFSRVEFYVNGGTTGGQTFYFVIQKYYQQLDKVSLNTLLGIPSIPPNVWLKASYTFSSSMNFTSILLMASGNYLQPKIYFDDLVLVSKEVLKVTDFTGCTVSSSSFQISSPPVLSVTTSVIRPICYGLTDGTFTVTTSGGTKPYNYAWVADSRARDDPIENTIEGLPESIVTVNVTDIMGCTAPSIVFSVLQPAPLSARITVSPPKCYGGEAMLAAEATGAVAPYTYSWTSEVGSPRTVAQPSPLSIFLDSFQSGYNVKGGTKINITCLGTGSHLGLPYSPSFSGYCSFAPMFTNTSSNFIFGGGSTQSLSPLRYAGIHYMLFISSLEDADLISMYLARGTTNVTDAVPLSEVIVGNITAPGWNEVFYPLPYQGVDFRPDQLIFNCSAPELLGTVFFDEMTLIPNVNSSSGVGVYAGFRSIVTGGATTYHLALQDANLCLYTKDIVVSQPAALSITSNLTAPSYKTLTDGIAEVTAHGGTPPYRYYWSELALSSSVAQNIDSGAHVVQVTDFNGCIYETTVYVPPAESSLAVLKPHDRQLSGGLGALVGFAVILCFFAMYMMWAHWQEFRGHGSFYSGVLLFGIMLSYVSVIVLLPTQTDALCTAFPWLIGIAFILVYGCLFIKTWALYRVWWKAAQCQKANLTPFYIAKVIGVFLAIEIVFLTIWTVIDPPHIVHVKMINNTMERMCDTDTPIFWIVFMTIKGAWLIFGAILSVLTRHVVKEFNESRSIAYAIYNNVVLIVIAVPLAILLKEVPGGRLVIEVTIIVLAFSFTMIILFFRVWYRILFPKQEAVGKSMTMSLESASTSTKPNSSPHNSQHSRSSHVSSHDSSGHSSRASPSISTV